MKRAATEKRPGARLRAHPVDSEHERATPSHLAATAAAIGTASSAHLEPAGLPPAAAFSSALRALSDAEAVGGAAAQAVELERNPGAQAATDLVVAPLGREAGVVPAPTAQDLSALQTLSRLLAECDATTPQALQRQVAAASAALSSAVKRLQAEGRSGRLMQPDTGPLGEPSLARVVVDVFSMLQRASMGAHYTPAIARTRTDPDVSDTTAGHTSRVGALGGPPNPRASGRHGPAVASQGGAQLGVVAPEASLREKVFALSALLDVVCACFSLREEAMVDINVDLLGTPDRAAVQPDLLEQTWLSLAACQPCASLAAVFVTSPGGRITCPPSVTYQAVDATARLLLFAARFAVMGAALLPELQATQLLARACGSVRELHFALPADGEGGREVSTLLTACAMICNLDGDVGGGSTGAASQRIRALLLHTPEVGGLLVDVIARWGLRPNPGSSAQTTASLMCQTFAAAVWWWAGQVHDTMVGSARGADSHLSGFDLPAVARSPASAAFGGAADLSTGAPSPVTRLPSATRHALTGRHLSCIVQAAGLEQDHVCVGMKLLCVLWGHLSTSEQGRAFFDVVNFAHLVVGVVQWEVDGGAKICIGLGGSRGGVINNSDRTSDNNSALPRPKLREPATTPACGPGHRIDESGADAAAVCIHGAASSPWTAASLGMSALDCLLLCVTPNRFWYHAADADCVFGGTWYRPHGVPQLWSGLQSRALWMLRSGVLSRCEGLLRGDRPPKSVSHHWRFSGTFRLAVSVAALLGDGPSAPAAVAAALGMAVSLRKQLHRMWALAGVGGRPGGKGAVAADSHISDPDDNDVDWGITTRNDDVGLCGTGKLDTATLVLYQLMSHTLLQESAENAGSAATRGVKRCLVMLLLPLAVRVTLADLSMAPAPRRGRQRVGSPAHLLTAIAAANQEGMADITAAAGAPQLLAALLTSGRRGKPASMVEVELGVTALLASGCYPAWRAEARRLCLPQLLMSAVTAAPPAGTPEHAAHACSDAPGTAAMHLSMASPSLLATLLRSGSAVPLTFAHAVRIDMRGMARYLQQNDFAAGSAERPPTDTVPDLEISYLHASSMLAQLLPAGPAQARRLLGCWSRRCTNLEGDSEVALLTRKCGGCRTARYCSPACQRSAWRSGHRAACQAWQRQHPALHAGSLSALKADTAAGEPVDRLLSPTMSHAGSSLNAGTELGQQALPTARLAAAEVSANEQAATQAVHVAAKAQATEALVADRQSAGAALASAHAVEEASDAAAVAAAAKDMSAAEAAWRASCTAWEAAKSVAEARAAARLASMLSSSKGKATRDG